jgi:hypothetical protein
MAHHAPATNGSAIVDPGDGGLHISVTSADAAALDDIADAGVSSRQEERAARKQRTLRGETASATPRAAEEASSMPSGMHKQRTFALVYGDWRDRTPGYRVGRNCYEKGPDGELVRMACTEVSDPLAKRVVEVAYPVDSWRIDPI